MERSGPGVDDYEFRPPLAQSARKAAAKAFEAAKPDPAEGAAKRGRPRKEKANKEANTNDETAGREDETAGVAEWADGDRVIAMDLNIAGDVGRWQAVQRDGGSSSGSSSSGWRRRVDDGHLIVA